MTKFQVILTAVFGIFILIGVALFATYKNTNSATLPAITVWGTVSADDFNKFVYNLNLRLAKRLDITYVEKRPDTFDQEFISALARGESPDAIIAPADIVFKEEDKLVPIPYNVYSVRDYKNTYIQEAELFLTDRGIMAFPFSVDPLVMYWNRDIFTNAGIATYPREWDELVKLNEKVTDRDNTGNLLRSLVGLGEYRNINHAKEILSTLFMQVGDPIVERGENGLQAVLGNYAPADAALKFYTDFSNPAKVSYSWNRALPNSKNYFIGGKLGLYFGFASEAKDIKDKNPNLNFDIAPIPQPKGVVNKVTYGNMLAFAIPKLAPGQQTAYTVGLTMTSPDASKIWTDTFYLPPVRRDLLAQGTTDPYLSLFYDAAIISKTWLDRHSDQSSQIFQNMVESIISGRSDAESAISTARQALNISSKQ